MNLTHDDLIVSFFCNLFNLNQLIRKPTRVTLGSSKIIDHIYIYIYIFNKPPLRRIKTTHNKILLKHKIKFPI